MTDGTTDPAAGGTTNAAPGTPPPLRLPVGVLVAFGAAAVGLIASFLPWARVFVFSVSGINGDGAITAIASAVAIALLVAALRVPRRVVLLTGLASLALAVSAVTYVLAAARLSQLVSDARQEMFGGLVSPGFGLVVGVVSSVIALVVSVTLIHEARTHRSLRQPSVRWGARPMAVITAASGAASFTAFVDWWVVSIVLGALSGVVWITQTRPQITGTLVATIGMIGSLGAIGGGVVEGILDSSHSSSTSCTSIFSTGAKVDTVSETDTCNGDEGLTFVFNDTITCTDGRDLVRNDFGWGYRGGAWTAADERVAPLGTCTGLAADRCADAFAPGTITDERWSTTNPRCLGADGTETFLFTLSWNCWNSGKRYLQNEFGWGFIGEPWQAGEPPSDC